MILAQSASGTPSWVLLAVSISGVVGTLAGVIITQWASDRRERTNREAEWARADELRRQQQRDRTQTQRVAAYGEIFSVLDLLQMMIHKSQSDPDAEPDSFPTERIRAARRDVSLYGREDIKDLVDACALSAEVWYHHWYEIDPISGRPDKPGAASHPDNVALGMIHNFVEERAQVLRLIRQDLGVEPAGPTNPGATSSGM
ncbi:hypothetical protein LWC33_34115 [Pseudonocardia sp. RS11V-5]|uniref:hypothetical protein n=1 Tax=Pseudonocardia terrae TaxID=2905831 RepID=UPI001E53E87E|nr:hypothetical protein [Pseudonocardia terrae]MCE3556463.1 hypothetical protein [Pseudonocardia terrae]